MLKRQQHESKSKKQILPSYYKDHDYVYGSPSVGLLCIFTILKLKFIVVQEIKTHNSQIELLSSYWYSIKSSNKKKHSHG